MITCAGVPRLSAFEEPGVVYLGSGDDGGRMGTAARSMRLYTSVLKGGPT